MLDIYFYNYNTNSPYAIIPFLRYQFIAFIVNVIKNEVSMNIMRRPIVRDTSRNSTKSIFCCFLVYPVKLLSQKITRVSRTLWVDREPCRGCCTLRRTQSIVHSGQRIASDRTDGEFPLMNSIPMEIDYLLYRGTSPTSFLPQCRLGRPD